MGGERVFQICYDGDLTVEVCAALRKLHAEPNFDQSWRVMIDGEREAATVARYLRILLGANARLLVARCEFTRNRDYVLVRHSLTPGADYSELHDALERLGTILEIPFESTFIVETSDATDLQTLGEALAQLCPDESIMVIGIARDFAFCTSGLGKISTDADVAFVVGIDE